jgi:hypothetical protein
MINQNSSPDINPSDVTSTSTSILHDADKEMMDATLLQCGADFSTHDIEFLENNDPIGFEITKQIKTLKAQIKHLYTFLKPQTITIYNFYNLKVNTAVTTVKDKINSLFYECGIPVSWKITVTWTEKTLASNNSVVDTVTITMVNYFVKEKTVEIFNKHFSKCIHISNDI